MKHLIFYPEIVKEYSIKSEHLISKYLPLNSGTEISEYIIIQFNIIYLRLGFIIFLMQIFKKYHTP